VRRTPACHCLPHRRALPLNLSSNAILYKGTVMAALGMAMQVRPGAALCRL